MYTNKSTANFCSCRSGYVAGNLIKYQLVSADRICETTNSHTENTHTLVNMQVQETQT